MVTAGILCAVTIAAVGVRSTRARTTPVRESAHSLLDLPLPALERALAGQAAEARRSSGAMAVNATAAVKVR